MQKPLTLSPAISIHYSFLSATAERRKEGRNGTRSYGSGAVPVPHRAGGPTNHRPVRRGEPHAEGDGCTAGEGPAMQRPRQRSLHRHDGEVLLLPPPLQTPPREAPLAFPGIKSPSLPFPPSGLGCAMLHTLFSLSVFASSFSRRKLGLINNSWW